MGDEVAGRLGLSQARRSEIETVTERSPPDTSSKSSSYSTSASVISPAHPEAKVSTDTLVQWTAGIAPA
jgi:hypothetical protein